LDLVDTNILDQVLKNYVEISNNILGCAIVDSDGLIIASEYSTNLEDLTIGALTALLHSLGEKIHKDFDTGFFKNATLQIQTQILMFTEIEERKILTTILKENSSIDEILPFSKMAIEKIAKVINGKTDVVIEFKKIEEKPKHPVNFKPVEKLIYKLVVTGDSGVGKTSLLVQFAKKRFVADYKPTLGVDIFKYSYMIEERAMDLMAWDVSGEKIFSKFRKSYYPGAEAIFILYDVTNPESFNDVDDWIKEIKPDAKKDVVYVLIGNKIDLKKERKISEKKGKKLANKFGFIYYETSAKTGKNIDSLFKYIGKIIIDKKLK